MRFVNDPIVVNMRTNAEGQVQPLAFVWHGRHYPITGVGRTYTQNDERYFLVMTPGDRVFELRWNLQDNCWFVSRAPESRLVI